MTEPADRASLTTALGAVLVFAVLAVWLVPWDPVPGGSLEPAPVGSVFTDAEVRQAEAFARWARVWSWGALAVALLVACWLAFSRRGRRLFGRLRGPWWVQTVAAVALFAVIGMLATLPLAVARHALRRDYGLSHQSWPGFAVDTAKAELVGIAITSLGVLVLVACARRWRRGWPAAAAALAGGLVVVGSFVYPVLIEPLFNDFRPLPDSPLRTQIMALAADEQVPVDEVLVVDASRRTTTLNAYVSGFGGTRRVVVYDTLVEALPRDQALTVVAHELAHAKHQDVAVGTALGAVGAAGGVGLLGVAVSLLRRRGLPAMREPQVVPVVLALVALGGLAADPLESGISRRIETRADVVALETTRDPGAFVAMQHRLARRSLADPTPVALAHWWWGSHPTVLERVALAERVGASRGL